MADQALIQTLWPLPGGQGRYLDTVVEFLGWLEPRAGTARQDVFAWFSERYNAAKSAPGYLSVLRNLGVVELERGTQGAVTMTGFGRAVLGADPRERIRLVATRLLSGFVAAREVLELFVRVDDPIPVREVLERLGPSYPTWTTIAQYEYRLEWLYSLGLLQRVTGRTFAITDEGRH